MLGQYGDGEIIMMDGGAGAANNMFALMQAQMQALIDSRRGGTAFDDKALAGGNTQLDQTMARNDAQRQFTAFLNGVLQAGGSIAAFDGNGNFVDGIRPGLDPSLLVDNLAESSSGRTAFVPVLAIPFLFGGAGAAGLGSTVISAGAGALAGAGLYFGAQAVYNSTKSTQSKPTDASPGTKPIDQSGLPKDSVHDIKDGVGAGAKDWTGIAPNGDVITSGPDGKAINHGPKESYLPGG